MVEKICWPDGFSCDAQLSSPRWRTLVGTCWWISPLTATRWVPSRGCWLGRLGKLQKQACRAIGRTLFSFCWSLCSSSEYGQSKFCAGTAWEDAHLDWLNCSLFLWELFQKFLSIYDLWCSLLWCPYFVSS